MARRKIPLSGPHAVWETVSLRKLFRSSDSNNKQMRIGINLKTQMVTGKIRGYYA